MSKKLKTIKKYVAKKVRVDPLYQSFWYSKFMNKFMLQGKKHVIEKTLSKTFFNIKMKMKREPLTLMFIILMRTKPLLGMITKRLGKEWKTIPVPLEPRRQLVIALKWLVSQVKIEPERKFETRLLKVFTKFFKIKKNALIRYRNTYYYNITKDRVNTRFRWK